MTTFWPQPNGIRYPRCVLPASRLGAKVLDYDEQRAKWDDPLHEQEGPGVWQLIANWARFKAMKESQRRFGASFLEIDDDYTSWQPSYQRGNWQEKIPPEDIPNMNSPLLHREVAAAATGVIVSTDYLAEKLRKYSDNVHVCQNSVDPVDWPAPPARDDGIFRIMFAGSPNLQDLRLIRRGIEWAARQDGVEVTIIGWNPPPELRFRGVTHVGWFDDISIARAVMVNTKPDVGLRPLETTEFSRSKSDLKILEYAMCGAMSLVTPWEPYLGWRETDLVKYAYDIKDWEQQIKWCVKHQDEVREMGRESRELVLKTRTIDSVVHQWEEVLDSAAVAV